MAKVKFFSESDCKVYIDTKLVGDVLANQILSVELHPGSYLVDIKSGIDEHCQRYILNVESGQSQIIQDVSYKEDSLQRYIERLQENPSIMFHNNRCKIEYDGKYGFINSRFEIIINPIYSDVGDFLTDKILVKKIFSNVEKATIIDVNGNMIYGKWFDYIDEDTKKVVLLQGNNFVVVSKVDYSIIAEYKRIRDYHPNKLIPVGKRTELDEMYGYIDSVGNEVIPFIFNKAYNFDESGFAYVERHGKECVVDNEGNIFTCLEDALKDGKEETRLVYDFGSQESVKENYIFKATKLSPTEAKIKDFSRIGMSDFTLKYTPVQENDKWGLDVEDLTMFDEEADEAGLQYICDKIFYFNNDYFAYRLNDKCIVMNFSEPDNIKTFRYDTIYPVLRWEHTYNGEYDNWELTSIIVSQRGKYGLIDPNGNELLPTEYDRIETTNAIDNFISGTIGIIWKEGKCSLVNLVNGVILDDIIYDDINLNPCKATDTNSFFKSTFIVKNGKKYGCRDVYFKEILPIEYDTIDFKYGLYCDGYIYKMIMSIGTRKGVYEFRQYNPTNNYESASCYTFNTEIEYDECVFLENKGSIAAYGQLSYVGVRKDSKWGILDATPSWASYYPIDDSNWDNTPNERDLEFKYDSLEDLIEDADNEFERRYKKYYRPFNIIVMGGQSLLFTDID